MHLREELGRTRPVCCPDRSRSHSAIWGAAPGYGKGTVRCVLKRATGAYGRVSNCRSPRIACSHRGLSVALQDNSAIRFHGVQSSCACVCPTYPNAAHSHESDGPGYPKAGVVSLRETELQNILMERVGAADRGSGSESVNVANCNQRQLVFALVRSAVIVRCLTAAVFEAAQLRMTSTGLNVSRSSLRPRPIFQARLHFAPM